MFSSFLRTRLPSLTRSRGFFKISKPQGKNAAKKGDGKAKIVTVYRFDPEQGDPPYLQQYEVVPEDMGFLVLDVLLHIKNEIDPSLTFRRSCREGVCGSCAMNINGQNGLACTSKIPDGNLTIYPLPHAYVIKDLVVDMDQFFNHYRKIDPWLQRCTESAKRERPLFQSIRDAQKMENLYECILCGCCSFSCPAYWWHGDGDPDAFLGPAALLQAYRWVIDSRDEFHHDRLKKLNDSHKVMKCHTIFNCTKACPKGLNAGRAISHLKMMMAGLMRKEMPDMPNDDDAPGLYEESDRYKGPKAGAAPAPKKTDPPKEKAVKKMAAHEDELKERPFVVEAPPLEMIPLKEDVIKKPSNEAKPVTCQATTVITVTAVTELNDLTDNQGGTKDEGASGERVNPCKACVESRDSDPCKK